MNLKEKKTYYILFVLGIVFITMFGSWWFDLEHVPNNFGGIFHIFDIIIFCILSYIVWQEIFMEFYSWLIAEQIKDKRVESVPVPQVGLRVAYITAFVPGIESYETLENTLRAMVEVDYPHDVWLLDEGNDLKAQEICFKYKVNHFSRKEKKEFNTESGKFAKKTKGGNYNSWLHHYQHAYDIVAQHDVDFIPHKNFLTRVLGYFNDQNVGFVGCPQVYGNQKDSWIADGASEQTYGFYGPLQRGLDGHGMTLLIGANHIVRTNLYKDVDGYTAHITEDMLTGMKIYTRPWKSIYVPEVLLVGEGPLTWVSYFNQQMRWSYGCMDILLRHAKQLLPKMSLRRRLTYLGLMQFYFAGLAQFLGIVLLTLYFFFGIAPARMTLMPLFYLYLPLIAFQTIFQLWLNRFNIAPESEKGLMLRGKLLFLSAWPIYFLAFIGVVRGKRLTYVVTPKGDKNISGKEPMLFIIHFIFGSITFIDILIGFYLHHTAGQMIFWATTNTIFMYFFFFTETIPVIKKSLQLQINKLFFKQGV